MQFCNLWLFYLYNPSVLNINFIFANYISVLKVENRLVFFYFSTCFFDLFLCFLQKRTSSSRRALIVLYNLKYFSFCYDVSAERGICCDTAALFRVIKMPAYVNLMRFDTIWRKTIILIKCICKGQCVILIYIIININFWYRMWWNISSDFACKIFCHQFLWIKKIHEQSNSRTRRIDSHII